MYKEQYSKEETTSSNGKTLSIWFSEYHSVFVNEEKGQNFKKTLGHFKCGKQKMVNELDIKCIIKSIRKSNALADALFNKKQQLLLEYQYSNVIYPEVKINPNKAIIKSNADYPYKGKARHDLNEVSKDLNFEEIDETTLKLMCLVLPPKNEINIGMLNM